ncbi:MAG: phosphoadenylyl-sulfate reductase [Rhodospirillaceae bacterium]|nr:phosphoadenylyl-sulfate reductase [Rhodospirillaceae bacterium]
MPVLDRTGARVAGEPAPIDLALEPDADLDASAAAIATAGVIGVHFPSLKDGRGFSVARLLRLRHGFKGDVRATGAFIPDQAAFLARCGFTSYAVPDGFDDAAFRDSLNRFPTVYQSPRVAENLISDLRQVTGGPDDRLQALRGRYGHLDARELLAAALTREFPGQIALVSSFGAESAVLLHMVSRIAADTPVLFLDTGKLFGETLRYRNALTAMLGLTKVTTIAPDPTAVAARDAGGVLWSQNADACCALRKVEPLARALAPFAAWITGRKGYQGATRQGLPSIEFVDGKFKFNPLAAWSRRDLTDYLDAHRLPRHPLEADGYVSIGCTPCTDRVQPGESPRAGRWRGRGKTECGIHAALVREATP